MRLLFIIDTPGQAHTWKYIIQELLARGHAVKIVARDDGPTLKLLAAFGLECSAFSAVGSRSVRLFRSLDHFQKCYELSRDFFPSMVMGFGIDAAVTSARFRKPCIVFIDDEPTHFQNNLTRLLASSIVTPDCFKSELGKKQIRIKGFKELAYLHPNRFTPDPTIYDELKILRGEKYVILRFNAFDALHDIRRHGFGNSHKFELVRELEKYVRVLISPEGSLPQELENRRLSIPFSRIHHALYYAQMIVSDGGTMVTEGALLGTHGVLCLSAAMEFGNFVELEKRWGLVHNFKDPSEAIKKSIELIQQPGLKEQSTLKRQDLLNEKIDVGRFMVDLIENYPESISRARQI